MAQLIPFPTWRRQVGLTTAVARAVVARREIPAVHVGKAVYLDRAGADAWLATRLAAARDRAANPQQPKPPPLAA